MTMMFKPQHIFTTFFIVSLVFITAAGASGQQQQLKNLRFQSLSTSSDPAATTTGLRLRLQGQEEDVDDQHLSTRSLQTNVFSSRFQVEFASTGNSDIPTGDILDAGDDSDTSFNEIQTIIQPVLDSLVNSYNGINLEDPLNRRITNVELVSGVVSDVAMGLNGRRQLQNFLNFQFILELTGECNGCPPDSALTNQVSNTGGNNGGGGRRRELEQKLDGPIVQQHPRPRTLLKKRTVPGPRGDDTTSQRQRRFLKQDKTGDDEDDRGQQQQQEKTGGSKDTSAPTLAPSPQPTPAPSPQPSPLPTKAPSPAPSPLPTGEPTLRPTSRPTARPTTNPTSSPTPPPDPDSFLPSEEEVRRAYDSDVMALNNELIQSVTGLQEVGFTCPANTPASEGKPTLNTQILDRCSPGLTGFLKLNIDQEGSFCLTTPSDDVGDNLRLSECDFDTATTSNNHAWTLLNQGNGIVKFQSTEYTNRCIKVGSSGGTQVFSGVRLRVGTCDDLYTEFEFDYETQHLKIANESYCVTNAGLSANENDTINARDCSSSTASPSKYQWLFVFA